MTHRFESTATPPVPDCDPLRPSWSSPSPPLTATQFPRYYRYRELVAVGERARIWARMNIDICGRDTEVEDS
jgi:hypothetical protein